MKYTITLDGIRGIAILSVLLFHYGMPYLSGGFYGVDIFFVLSGFLITSILLKEVSESGTISFKDFYVKRILRLFPALCFMLLLYGLMAFFFAINPQRHYIDMAIVFFYLSNWSRAFNFKHPAEMGHTWSLSIEEQFYLIWPAILCATFRRLGIKGLFAVTLLLAAFSALDRVLLLPFTDWHRLYNGFDTRMDTILYGCLLGILLFWKKENWVPVVVRKLAPFIGWSGIILYLFIGEVYSLHTYWYGILLVAIFSGCLIFSAVASGSPKTKAVLSSPLLVWLGKRSYGLYLWHYTINSILKIDKHGFATTLLAILLALAATEFSYRFVEHPFMTLKGRLVKDRKKNIPTDAITSINY